MDRIVVLDFGGQYAHLIARRVRSLGVYSEIASPMTKDFKDVKGIILSGGPSSVHEEGAPDYNPEVFGLGIPVLGICYGMQLMAYKLGGRVIQLEHREYGKAKLNVKENKFLFRELSDEEQVWMSHGDSIEEVPEGFEITGGTSNCPVAAMANQEKKLYGIQFHPEVTHTPNGMKILDAFLDECGIRRDWNPEGYIDKTIQEIKDKVGDGHVLMAASGGVDSTVAAVLLHRAIGESVYCVFVDTGLVRKSEAKNVREVFSREGIENLFIVDASDEFFAELEGVTEPEEKRRIISETFFKVFQRKAGELSKEYHISFLGQGTIYPDRIESAEASHTANKIKSHHNVLLPDWLELELVEPLRDLYKDEVREIGLQLGIHEDAVMRHPFPGPGLGVRILGELTKEKASLYKEVDEIVEYQIREAGWYEKLWMGFPVLVPNQEFEDLEVNGDVIGDNLSEREMIAEEANAMLDRVMKGEYDEARFIFLPARSVGVMGDARTYHNPLCLRITRGGKLADVDYEVLENISNDVISKVKGINRVILDVTETPRGWENMIVIRAVTSKDAMTADWAKLEPELLKKIADEIMKKEGKIQRVCYDITQKPPGTMEWE